MDIEKIKDLRVTIDRVSQLVMQLKPIKMQIVSSDPEGHFDQFYNSPQITKCHESLLLGKAWLGKLLQKLGQESPYKNDGTRHSVEDIEPTDAKADVRSTENTLYGDKNHVEIVDYLRSYMQEGIIDKISLGDYMEQAKAYTHIVEARFHLGFELERIREEKQ